MRKPYEQIVDGKNYESWSEIAKQIKKETGFDPHQVAVGTTLEQFEGVECPELKADRDTLTRVSNVIGSSGDLNSRELAKLVIAAVEGWDGDAIRRRK